MPNYIATKVLTISIKAPSASVARSIAEKGFAQQLSPADIKTNMAVSNIETHGIKIEKVN